MSGSGHIWVDDRCRVCGMHVDWEGARRPCDAEVISPLEKRHIEENIERLSESERREQRRRARIAADPEYAERRRIQVLAAARRQKQRRAASTLEEAS